MESGQTFLAVSILNNECKSLASGISYCYVLGDLPQLKFVRFVVVY